MQHLLRMGYAHAQMMLYRPFLHYVSHACKSRVMDKRSYACAAACVSVSRNIVHIACEMRRKGLLAGAYWFTMYTTFFAILSLVFYALENPDNDASQDVLRVANEGMETLRKLTKRSMAADRCATTLQVCLDFTQYRTLLTTWLTTTHFPLCTFKTHHTFQLLPPQPSTLNTRHNLPNLVAFHRRI